MNPDENKLEDKVEEYIEKLFPDVEDSECQKYIKELKTNIETSINLSVLIQKFNVYIQSINPSVVIDKKKLELLFNAEKSTDPSVVRVKYFLDVYFASSYISVDKISVDMIKKFLPEGSDVLYILMNQEKYKLNKDNLNELMFTFGNQQPRVSVYCEKRKKGRKRDLNNPDNSLSPPRKKFKLDENIFVKEQYEIADLLGNISKEVAKSGPNVKSLTEADFDEIDNFYNQ